MPKDALRQLVLLLILIWTHVSTTMKDCIEELQVAINKHTFMATSFFSLHILISNTARISRCKFSLIQTLM